VTSATIPPIDTTIWRRG